MRYFKLAILSFFAGFSFFGCFATAQNYSELRAEIASLKTVIGQMQSNQADLVITMQELNGSMIGLTEKLDDSKGRTSALSQKIDDIGANFNSRMDSLSAQLGGQVPKPQPSPSNIFDIAYNDYTQNHFGLSAVGFKNYLERYPQGELAEKAQYYLAESLYKDKDRSAAVDAYEKFLRLYPRSDFVKSAELRYYELLGKDVPGKGVIKQKTLPETNKNSTQKAIDPTIEYKKPAPAVKPSQAQPEKKKSTIKISPDDSDK